MAGVKSPRVRMYERSNGVKRVPGGKTWFVTSLSVVCTAAKSFGLYRNCNVIVNNSSDSTDVQRRLRKGRVKEKDRERERERRHGRAAPSLRDA
ncbi:hypothetical protein PUN28_001080 [Cardiocondyla obscurior]|uniref:Uncharacterized protein n=1 Tax=Cardiocondyla obscurior TaxID=286306 RepID=A0AAW2H3E0_9HYME